MTVSDGNDLFDTALVPFDKLFTTPNGTFVEGIVESIQPEKKADPSSSKMVKSCPTTSFKEVAAFIAEDRANFKKAQKIVLVGGGAVEFSGEIKDVWPPNHEFDISCPLPDWAREDLHARGIKIILNDFVDEIPAPGPTSVKTRNGHVIDADLVIPTRGPRPRTEFVAKSLGANTLDERNQIKVTPTLQLIDHPDIFAVGDAINTIEQKQVMKAMAHSGIVTTNIIAYLSGGTLKPYKGSTELIIVTNGKGGGKAYLGFLWGITLGAWFARMAKSKTLLVPISRGKMGY
ncbi:FAD/NAD-P-binding domain-containing protein [Mycena leptocephala]|nr:FAD/NAD-P-binding domain-containing protein [Mycena leptocephala]